MNSNERNWKSGRVGVARGCTWCTCTPRAEKKIWAYFIEESAKCTPRQSKDQISEDIFLLGGGHFKGWSGYLFSSFNLRFEGDDKKVVNFFEEKSAPQRKSSRRL